MDSPLLLKKAKTHMDENPWDFWLRSLLLEDAIQFTSEADRRGWRALQDRACDGYQQKYLAWHKAQRHLPWWEKYVSKNTDTWDYLDELTHPLDVASTNEELRGLGFSLESDDSI